VLTDPVSERDVSPQRTDSALESSKSAPESWSKIGCLRVSEQNDCGPIQFRPAFRNQ